MSSRAPRTLVEPELGVAANPVWSPDGRRIAFTLTDPRRPMDLHVADVASGAVNRLPDINGERLFRPPPLGRRHL
jgi:tricorn protease-like protein